MKPTKVTRARKRTAKERGVKGNPVLDKLMKLKYLINDAYKAGRDTEPVGASNKSDKDWVMEEITNLRNEGWLTATKMKVANEMWRKYGG